MSKNKVIQVRVEPELHKQAKMALFQRDMSMQEFLEAYIKTKFGKKVKANDK